MLCSIFRLVTCSQALLRFSDFYVFVLFFFLTNNKILKILREIIIDNIDNEDITSL